MALAWIYLKTFGQMTESLCDDLFWTFKKEAFKHALSCFIFDDIEDERDHDQDWEADALIDNIKIRFDKFLQTEYNGTITDWAKEMYTKVFIIFKLYFRHYHFLKNNILHKLYNIIH